MFKSILTNNVKNFAASASAAVKAAAASSKSKKNTSSFEADFKKRAAEKSEEKLNSYFPNPQKTLAGMRDSNQKNSILKTQPAQKPSLPTFESSTLPRAGTAIKNNIQNVLKNKYGELNVRHIFDGIDDKDIEDNISTAENAIQTNIDKGILGKDFAKKFPNLVDGLALSYAAANKGNNKAATRAREAAYMEVEPLVKETGIKLLSADAPKPNKGPYDLRLPTDKDVHSSSNYKNAGGEKPAERTHNPNGVRFKAEVSKNSQENSENNTKKSSNVTSPFLSGYDPWEQLEKELNKNNHKIYVAPTYPTSYYGRMEPTNDFESGELTKSELLTQKVISGKDLSLGEEVHIKNWKRLAKHVSVGEMQTVALNLIDHFIEGTGEDYSNPILTKNVKNNATTKRYMEDFSKVFDKQLQLHNGDIIKFADSDSFHTALRKNGVLLSTYDYSGIDDLFGGLEFAIHGWTESQVDVFSLNIEPDGSYSGTLRFTFKDNFGLNDSDVEKYGKYHDGFKSWFILQHYDEYDGKYKPFKTVVEIDYPVSGKIEGYKK